MLKYTMMIDNEIYNALFVDHFEGGDFLDWNVAEGSKVELVGYKEMTIADIMADADFEHAYKIECVAIITLPEYKSFKRWDNMEYELKIRGII